MSKLETSLILIDENLGPALESCLVDMFRAISRDFDNKDYKSRLNIYLDHMSDKGGMSLLVPDLQSYANGLYLRGYKDGYIRNHISTIRAAYQALVADRTFLYTNVAPIIYPVYRDMPFIEQDAGIQKAVVDEIVIRIENELNVKIKVTVIQDKADSEVGIRLESFDLLRFLTLPTKYKETNPARYYRDKAMLNLIASTGIRESELIKLTIADLYQTFGGYPALRIRHGKGKKQRMIPYGDNNPLPVIENWLEISGIDDIERQGNLFAFCAIGKDGRVKDNGQPLTTRTIQRIFECYSKDFGQKIRPHDLRRTYAYLLWTKGVDLVVIKSNLGHSRLEETLGYIGNINAAKRLAPKIF